MPRLYTVNLDKCKSVADEILALVPTPLKYRTVFLRRVIGPSANTRVADGLSLNVSDERIRQIEIAQSRDLVNQMSSANFVFIPKAINAFTRVGTPFTWMAWEKEIAKEKIDLLGHFPSQMTDVNENTVFERFVYLLRAFLINGGAKTEILSLPSGLIEILSDIRASDLPRLFDMAPVPMDIRREIAKKVNDAGAIPFQFAMSLIGGDEEGVKSFLLASGYAEPTPGWFSFDKLERYAKSVFINACAKMSRACGLMPVDIMREGVLRAAKRYASDQDEGIVVPPLDVFRSVLILIGFSVDQDDNVRMDQNLFEVGGLNKAELVFLDALRTIGPVLSIYDLVECLKERDLSVSSVNNVLLQWSPLLEKVKAPTPRNRGRNATFYKLRGSMISGADINVAVMRNFCEGSDPSLELFSEDIYDYYVTAGRYMLLTGVFNGSKLDLFEGRWSVISDQDMSLGEINVFPPSVWGADDLVKSLSIKVGARLRFRFDKATQKVHARVLSAPAGK